MEMAEEGGKLLGLIKHSETLFFTVIHANFKIYLITQRL